MPPVASFFSSSYAEAREKFMKAAEAAGFVLKQRSLNKAPFYFSRLLAFEKA